MCHYSHTKNELNWAFFEKLSNLKPILSRLKGLFDILVFTVNCNLLRRKMKHIRNIALTLLISVFSSSIALAEYTMGVSGAIAYIDASGTETEGGEQNKANADHVTPVASIFFEANDIYMPGLSLGIDYIPMSADVSDKVRKRTDTENSVTGTAAETSTTRNQSAQAELNDHLTFYANYDLNDTIYFKLGYVNVDLDTVESLPTGSKYGNKNIDGILLGFGTEFDVGSNSVGRLEFTHTNYKDIELTSSVARTGVSQNNTIDADLDVTQIKASFGYKF